MINSFDNNGRASGSSTSISDKSFVPQYNSQQSHTEARANIHPRGKLYSHSTEKLYLSIGYVEFEDGSTWGEDYQKQSEHISGFNEGRKAAVKHIKNLLGSQNKNELTDLFKKSIEEINSPVANDKQTEKWQRGFSSGYKFVWFTLKNAYEDKDLEAVSQKLQQIENPAKPVKK